MPKNLVPNQFDYSGIYVEGQRSQFRFNKPHLASFMSGMLVPLGDPIRVFPGVKLDLNIKAVIRSNTMVVPPLDGIYIDFFTVWVPDRIVWTHQPQFLGENDTTAWTQSTTYVYPSVTYTNLNQSVDNVCKYGSDDYGTTAGNLFLGTHYGLLTTSLATNAPVRTQAINILAHRGYYACWNHLFRDENYQRPVLFSKGDTGALGEWGYFLRDYKTKSNSTVLAEIATNVGTTYTIGQGLNYNVACLMPVNKFHDAYTSVLPQPQFASTGVELPLGDFANVKVWNDVATGISANSTLTLKNTDAMAANVSTSSNLNVSGSGFSVGTSTASGLFVDLSTATAATINELRSAVMYQRYLEALARGGRRVPEFYESIYAVKNTSAACDYPKLLTRARYLLGVNQVVATADGSGSGWTSHLGDTGAYSITSLSDIPCCEQDFSEFGYLHIFYCVRSTNRYSQMIQEHFTRSELLDEYNPYFDHIGDVGIKNILVNTTAASASNFGYQEAWWSERSQLGLAVGAVNKAYGSLAYWTLGEVFDSTLITCTPTYLTFDPAIFDDVFVSGYEQYPQFIMDALIYGKKVARMSQHSLPGIVGRI